MIILSVTILLMIRDINCMDGGIDADVGEFEYTVSIWILDQHRCTGAIIHETHVLTAGHCIPGVPIQALRVYTGYVDVEDVNSNVRTIERVYTRAIREIFISSDSGSSYFENDIAVLKLGRKLIWSPTVGSVPLVGNEYYWDPCELCVMSGWGVNEADMLSLAYVYVDVQSDGDCGESGAHLYSNQKCAQLYNSMGTALAVQGDSGAPIVCSNILVGILIRGYLAPDIPIVLLPVSPYLGFISEVINDGESEAHPGEFPYVVSLWHKDNYVCGGTIIDPSHILTAAYCVRDIQMKDLRIIVGKTYVSSGDHAFQWIYVDHIEIKTPHRADVTNDSPAEYVRNDIAILKLRTHLVWTPTVKSTLLPKAIVSSNGDSCQVLQWKSTNAPTESESRKLVWFTGQILSAEKCDELMVPLAPNQFCASSPYDFPLADYDDGGNPIICDGVVRGILISTPRISQQPLLQAIFIKIPIST